MLIVFVRFESVSYWAVVLLSRVTCLTGGATTAGSPDCGFGSGGRDTLCDYSNPSKAALSWRSSTGAGSNWVGGPPEDADNAKDGERRARRFSCTVSEQRQGAGTLSLSNGKGLGHCL